MKKEDLKTGMFGMMSNGKLFVIVNDLLVYQDRSFDYIEKMNEDFRFSYYEIEILVVARSFDNAEKLIKNRIKDGIIYDRKAQKETTAMTIAEIEEKLGIKNLVIKGE